MHVGDAGRCGELHGQAGLFQSGLVQLQVAHVDGAKTGESVPDDKLRALCARCHFGVDEEQHQLSRRAKVLRELEARGQMRLL